MDWATLALAFLGGGSLATVVSIFVFRHQAKRDNWADIQQSFKDQINSAEKRGDAEEETRLRQEYEAQLEAWRAQQGVEALAPRSISADMTVTLTEAAVEQLRALLIQSQDLDPAALSAEDHFLRGNAYHESGEYQQAVNSYNEALRLRPEFTEAYYNRGNAYQHLGEYRRALADYNEALRLRPENPEAYTNRGNAYRHLGEYWKALANYNEALKLRPEFSEAYNNRGASYADLGEHEKALADFTEALRLRSEFPEAYYNRGVAYVDLGEHQKALADYNEALRLRPEFLDPYYNLACLHSILEEIEPCVANLERATELDEGFKEKGQSDPDLEWARRDERVRKLLGLT